MSMWLFLIFGFTLIDTQWIKKYHPNFVCPQGLLIGIIIIITMITPFVQDIYLLALGILVWLAWVDHHYHHITDFSIVICFLCVLSYWIQEDLTYPMLKIIYVLPFVLLSLHQERMGWGDTWVVLALSFLLSAEGLRLWVVGFILLAALYGVQHKKTKTQLALIPFMALSYSALLILGKV
jgi:prepilin signal peptidase PulO-like enzyme (type II secretory pathway)